MAAATEIINKRHASAIKIKKWYTFWRGLHLFEKHGPAVFIRDICTNDDDFFSTDKVCDISGYTFFSYKDADSHVYGFDVRSLNMLIQRARLNATAPQNPFTRAELPTSVIRSLTTLANCMKRRDIPTEWVPLTPPTPEQQLRMKIVDLFTIIDSLNYYSSPDWFIGLDARGHSRFYRELYELWTHRAGISYAQKETIVPNFHARLFRYTPWTTASHPIETIQRVNLHVMRLMVTAADDRNDRILGAMYVITALTTVSSAARTAYPWLYESISGDNGDIGLVDGDVILQRGGVGGDNVRRNALVDLFGGIRWIADLLVPAHPPLLELPPAAEVSDREMDTSDDE